MMNGKRISMHSFIMNPSVNFEVDHINGNGLDNRKENLRICNSQQNARNRGLNKSSKTGFKGIAVTNNGRCFYSQMKVNGVRIYIGSFKTKEEAARAYDKASVEHFGKFARTNEMLGLFVN